MKTTETKQPKPLYADGSLEHSNYSFGRCGISTKNSKRSKKTIAEVYGSTAEEAEANAARLSKCWNMHDDLVSHIKIFVEYAEQTLSAIQEKQRDTVKQFINSSKELIEETKQR